MLLTRPMIHHNFQLNHNSNNSNGSNGNDNDFNRQSSDITTIAHHGSGVNSDSFHDHATSGVYGYDTIYTVDNIDLGLSSYAAALDAGSPPSPTGSVDDVMHDAWLPHTKPASRFAHAISHHRDSSLGSLSASGTVSGPASPASPAFTFTSTPHIAVTDDGQGIPPAHGTSGDYYQLAKSYAPAHDAFYPNYPAFQADPSAAAAYTNMLASHYKPKSERGLLPPPELSTSSRSRPVSVASSIASADSPATPAPGEPEERKHKNIGFTSAVPKFERTMTDVFGDELFNPNFAIDTLPSQAQSPQQAASPGHEIFAQRLQAANSQHMSPVGGLSRGRSPFRNGSPLAPSPLHDFPPAYQQSGQQPPRQMGFKSAQQMRERRKAEQDAEAMRQQLQGPSLTARPTQTISPKDVTLEFPDADSEAHNFPLFPQGPSTGADAFATADSQANKAAAAVGGGGLPLDFYGHPGVSVPQQYPFVAVGQVPIHEGASASPIRSDLARPASSAPSQTSSGGGHRNSNISSPQRPASVRADGGTYSCTYHGCTQRFDTPALLQKHKREGHRQGPGASGRRLEGDRHGSGVGMTSSLLNTQQGPHRCDRINPSTNKPCATIFSRPYDLTRHEDTIHNGRKQKVRCQICTGEEKTFSRADALTRHYRVVHPDLEVPGKHRRRAVNKQH